MKKCFTVLIFHEILDDKCAPKGYMRYKSSLIIELLTYINKNLKKF